MNRGMGQSHAICHSMNVPVKNTRSKGSLHPRNRHQGHYDFPALIACYPELQRFVIRNPYGKPSIDFADPQAVRHFNRALLKSFYHLDYWNIPEGYLCPPVPGRADYLHNLADLLALDNAGEIPYGETIRILDIGVGANCIYPLIGHCEYRWQFVGADVAPEALRSAQNIIRRNPTLNGHVELRRQEDRNHVISGLVKPGERFFATLCNPPFHRSLEEASRGSQRKWRNLGRLDPKRRLPTLNFGGQAAELWCNGGEAGFVRRMIEQSRQYAEQVLWFTTLLSKSGNLPSVQAWLKRNEAHDVRILDMAQGQKQSRLVAWTYLNEQQRQRWFSQSNQ